MAQRAIREYDGKALFAKVWDNYFAGFKYGFESVLVTSGAELKAKAKEPGFEWLNTKPLVAKPDMLFGKRGKNNLVLFKDQKPGDVSLDKANIARLLGCFSIFVTIFCSFFCQSTIIYVCETTAQTLCL